MRLVHCVGAFAFLTFPGAAQGQHAFVCIPDSVFRLGAVAIGDSGSKAVGKLGTPVSVVDAVEHGMDRAFPITVYRFKDVEVTVTHSSGLVAAIRPLTSLMRTPSGLRLGMSRGDAERLFPPGALKPLRSGNDPDTTAREAYSCGGKASTVLLEFDSSRSRVSRITLYGFFGKPE